MSLAKRLADSGIRGPLFDRYASQIESGIYKRDQQKYIDDRKELEKHMVTLQGRDKPGNSEKRKGLDILIEEMDKEARMATNADTAPILIPSTVPFIPSEEKPCSILYDPCTREPLTGMSELENRIKEIKRIQQISVSEAEERLPDMSRLDLLVYILNRPTKPDITLLQYAQSGNIYEALWDIVLCFGLLEEFPINNAFHLYKGKAEDIRTFGDANFTKRRLEYLDSRKLFSGATGVSDITFMYSNKDTLHVSDDCSINSEKTTEKTTIYFCSSKYYKKDASKGVDKFDIQNIVAAAKHITEDHIIKIILLVKDSGAVKKILQRALRKYISEEASYVFGIEDLLSQLTKLYDSVHDVYKGETIEKNTLGKIFGIEDEPKPLINLRLHQHMAVTSITKAINNFISSPPESTTNKFLVGILPRGGKTFIAGGIVHVMQPKNVVVLLGAKSETIKQFKGELFEYYSNFSSYKCMDVVEEQTDPTINPADKHIFIMSVELYKTANSSRRLLNSIKTGELHIDLFICDEAHLKQTTTRAAAAINAGTVARTEIIDEEDVEVKDDEELDELQKLDAVIRPSVPVVYMTGTYIKPLTAFNIPQEHTALWDYEDIQMGKQLSSNEEYFQTNFGDIYNKALEKCMSYGETYSSIEEQYKKFPELYLFTTDITPEAKTAFAIQEGGVQTITQLFQVKKSFNPTTVDPRIWHTGFTNPSGMMTLLNYLCPREQIADIIQEEGGAPAPVKIVPSVMHEIDYLAQSIGDRLGFFTSNFVAHSQLWFLPHMSGHPLLKRMCALAGAIFQLPWFREHFEIVAVSSSANWSSIHGSEDKSIVINGGRFSWKCPNTRHPDGLKGCLVDLEKEARARNKGLIILAQNMLHLGISLKCVDIVVLLDDGKKVDERIQKMYRALTESTNKRGGYIVDMNYFRTVTAIMNYAITTVESRQRKKVYDHDLPDILNNVYNVYSINASIPFVRTDIQKTLPEIQRMLGNRRGGDSIVVGEAGAAMNRNIDSAIGLEYKEDYDKFLGMIRESIEKQRIIREHGKNVKKAKERSEETEEVDETENAVTETPIIPDIIDPKATDVQKKAAYIDIFKTTLKLGVFGTTAPDVSSLISRLQSEEELRDILFETLIKRGVIVEDTQHRDDEKRHLIDYIIIPGLEKLVRTEKNVSYRGMKESFEDEQKYPEGVQDVLTYIDKHLAPKDAERHKYGEVFTPMLLVNEMLDTLPANVWNNPDLKWLDPANGMGNYPIAVFMRLCYGFRIKDGKFCGPCKEGEGTYNPGLTDIIKNETVRKRHIVQNMLFMVELNRKNIAISKRLFYKLAHGVEPNIIQMHRTDGFLADVDMKFPNGTVREFDIVMGNPPYNKGTILRKQTLKIKKNIKDMGLEDTKRESIWTKFVLKIFNKNILKKNGYLLFITPINWFHPETTGVRDILLSKQIDYIKIYSLYDSMKKFGGSGKLATVYYLIQNKEPTKPTQIIDMLNHQDTIKLNPDSIIILAYNSIYDKVCDKSKLFLKTDSIKSTAVKKCITGNNKQIIGIYNDGLIKYVKTNEKHPLTDTPKIIINGYTFPRYYYDKAGEYGKFSKDGTNFIITGENLDNVKDYFDTKLSALLLNYIKFTQEKIEPKYYPDVRTLPLEKITDETLADYFGFTKEEREAINATEYPKREYKFKEITCAQLKGEKAEAGDSDAESGGKKRRFTRKVRRV